jgi:hypothetical protein
MSSEDSRVMGRRDLCSKTFIMPSQCDQCADVGGMPVSHPHHIIELNVLSSCSSHNINDVECLITYN